MHIPRRLVPSAGTTNHLFGVILGQVSNDLLPYLPRSLDWIRFWRGLDHPGYSASRLLVRISRTPRCGPLVDQAPHARLDPRVFDHVIVILSKNLKEVRGVDFFLSGFQLCSQN